MPEFNVQQGGIALNANNGPTMTRKEKLRMKNARRRPIPRIRHGHNDKDKNTSQQNERMPE